MQFVCAALESPACVEDRRGKQPSPNSALQRVAVIRRSMEPPVWESDQPIPESGRSTRTGVPLRAFTPPTGPNYPGNNVQLVEWNDAGEVVAELYVKPTAKA